MKKRMMRALALTLALVLMYTSALAAGLVLRPNDTGDAVKRLQQALIQLGYMSGEPDGKYGLVTERAVRQFQENYGLIADGKAGEATLYQIQLLTGIVVDTAPAVTPNPSQTDAPAASKGLFGGYYHKLDYGSSGDRVRVLQRALLELGFDIKKIDGVYGSSTFAAVKEFQRLTGLSVDGKAGEKTLKKLETFFDENGNRNGEQLVVQEQDTSTVYGEPKRTLRLNSVGQDVLYTQQRLVTLGYYRGTLDGVYGTGMVNAVKAFQKKNNLTEDGVLGAASRVRLFSTGAIGANEKVEEQVGERILREGMSGEDVKSMQARLKTLGYYNGTTDGKFGAGTLAALKAFQARNGLKADGVCGSDTVRVLWSQQAVDAGSSITPVPPTVVDSKPVRILRPGDKGDDVKSVQQRLSLLGYYGGSLDGAYGTGTTQAVEYFQRRNGLTVDGKVGSKTANVLYSANAIAADVAVTPQPSVNPNRPTRTLRLGAEGEDVKLLQSRLMELGYYAGKVDGKFGSGTSAAVTLFQLRNGLNPDGVAGTKTYAKLYSSSAISSNLTPTTTIPGVTGTIPSRQLYQGCSGDDVKSVQTRLKALGYYTGKIDGKYGSGTTSAMASFQLRNGLTPDGVGTSTVYAVLYSATAVEATTAAPAPTVPGTVTSYSKLTLGSTGNEVLRLQQMLASLKYTVNITGTYDEATRAAVIAFQQRNGLTVDGIAGVNTQTKLYSGSCVTGDTALPNTGSSSGSGSLEGGSFGPGPATSQVQLLQWYRDIKPTVKSGQTVTVYEPASGSTFRLRFYSLGQHADSEPLTAQDTATMKAAWGGAFSWDEKPVYVQLPNGTWCIASMHCMPHLSGSIKTNDFDGHLCVHFPRLMSECQQNAPDNGVRHQNDIRKAWKRMTGEDIPW